MLQADAELPEVAPRPAPWALRGSGWIVALRLPAADPARDAFLPPELTGRARGVASFLMYVDYAESGCGPYRELLFIPGTLPFADGRNHLSISRILVSTWESVVNGRANWGIPKDRADFAVEQGGANGSTTRVRVTSGAREVCELDFGRARLAPALPVTTALVPSGLRTLAQRLRGRTHYYAPQARGWVRPGRLRSWRFDAGLFPDLAGAKVLATVEVVSFRLTFPEACVAD